MITRFSIPRVYTMSEQRQWTVWNSDQLLMNTDIQHLMYWHSLERQAYLCVILLLSPFTHCVTVWGSAINYRTWLMISGEPSLLQILYEASNSTALELHVVQLSSQATLQRLQWCSALVFQQFKFNNYWFSQSSPLESSELKGTILCVSCVLWW